MTTQRLSGTLARDAEARITAPDGTYRIYIELEATPDMPAVRAYRQYAAGNVAAMVARSAANQLRRGAGVYVHCRGLHHTETRDGLVLLCVDVEQIEPLGKAPTRTEAEPRQQQGELTRGGVMRL